MAPFGFKLWENAFQIIPDISFFDAEKHRQTNLSKTISLEKFLDDFFTKKFDARFCLKETGDLGEPDTFVRHWQIRRKKLLPEVGLLLGRLPWRRGKRLNLCRKS